VGNEVECVLFDDFYWMMSWCVVYYVYVMIGDWVEV